MLGVRMNHVRKIPSFVMLISLTGLLSIGCNQKGKLEFGMKSQLASTGTNVATTNIDGAALYTTNCSSCHNPLATSTKKGRDASQITNAINSISNMSILKNKFTAAQISAIANALSIGGTGPTPTTPVACDTSKSAPAPARVWKLTNLQYNNTIKDLLGISTPLADQFERDSTGAGFRGGAKDSYVSQILAEQYETAARSMATSLTSNLTTLLPCTPADANNEVCVTNFISSFGKKVFRNPPSSAQRTAYLNLYRTGKSTSGLVGVQMVIEAMLQSPDFLYRFELGAEGSPGPVVTLTPYEVASQLSYLFWNAPPDATLIAAADANALSTQAQISAQADRLMQNAKARDMMADFFAQLFTLDSLGAVSKNTTQYPAFTSDLKKDFSEETKAFVKHVVFDSTGTMDELFSANYSFVNSRLASVYGVSGVSGTALQKIAMPAGQRSGLLTQGAFLTLNATDVTSNPVLRGAFVREKLLCQQMPPPPPNVSDTPPTASNLFTTRDRYAEHSKNQTCYQCHRLMDPIGFGLENFNAIGGYRTQENGYTVDSSGEINNLSVPSIYYKGPIELGKAIGSSADVANCMSTQVFRYVMGRNMEEIDQCSAQKVQQDFSSSNRKILTIFQSLTTTDTFTKRSK